jgi:hypothetical protein
MLDIIDKIVIVRSMQVNRTDILHSSRVLYLLAVIREQSHKNRRCDHYSVNAALRACYRTLSIQAVFAFVTLLVEAGYVRRSPGRGSRLSITQSGLQVLRDLNRALEVASYPRKKVVAGPAGKKTAKGAVKRPGLL